MALLPLVFAFVLGALPAPAVTFRSLVVPATAIVLNLLSVRAAYGMLVLIFQTALESLLGFRRIGASSSGCRCSCS